MKEKKKFRGLISIFLSILPIILFVKTKVEAERDILLRQSEVASWARKVPSPSFPIKTIETHGLNANRLVAAGVVESAVADEELVVQDWGEHCVSKLAGTIRDNLSGAALARNAFFSCTKKIKLTEPVSAGIHFFSGRSAPSRDKRCGNKLQTLEIRWSEEKGGELIAFQESPHHFSIPLPLMGTGTSITSPFGVTCNLDRGYSVFEKFDFAASAFGIENATAIPRKATEEDLLTALRILNTKKRANEKAVIALLGQWPSTPAISAFIRNEIDHDEWTYEILAQVARWSEVRDLLPHLTTHASDFLEICPKTVRNKKHCDSFRQRLGSNS